MVWLLTKTRGMRDVSVFEAILRQAGISTGTNAFGSAFSSTQLHQVISYPYNLQLHVMRFGFGVGDFLAVAEMSKKIWDRFEKSPSYVKDTRQEWVSRSLPASCVVKTIGRSMLTLLLQSPSYSVLHPERRGHTIA